MAAQKRLNRDELVSTALAVADAEGLEAVTIRRLAQQHEVTPMALYRHFPDKEGVLDAIAERLLSDARCPEPDERPWPEQMHDLMTAILDALIPHPNAATLLTPRILGSEAGLNLTERTLALLFEAGMTREDAADTACQVLAALISLVVSEPGRAHGPDPDAQEEALRAKRALFLTLSPRRYPHIIASADALVSCASRDSYYRRGVLLLVTGIRGTVSLSAA